jgi:hypothetical protein
MNPFPPHAGSDDFPPRGGHLDRLHGNLLDLDDRLREAVAGAIGQAAAGVVRQAVQSLLRQADDSPALLRLAPRPTSRARPLWETLDDSEEPDRLPWRHAPEQRGRSPWPDEAQAEAFLPDREGDRTSAASQPARWRQLLGFALPVLGWWLYRRAGRRAVGAALGCGVLCALARPFSGRPAGGTGLALTLLTQSVAAVARRSGDQP